MLGLKSFRTVAAVISGIELIEKRRCDLRPRTARRTWPAQLNLIDLDGMVGLDSHGNAGLRDQVDRHYKRLFGFAAMTSLFIAAFDISQSRNQSVLTYPSPAQTAGSAVGREVSETGAAITRRNLNVQPTIKVPVGYKFTIRVNKDIIFDAPTNPALRTRR